MSLDSYSPPPSLKALLGLTLSILLGGLMLGGSYLWYAADQQALHETRLQGHALARQTTFLVRPLLLADDRISQNYLLKELAELDYVTGLELTTPDGTVLARAGIAEGESIQRKMMQQEASLGTLTLWLNPAPMQQMLHRQLTLALLIALLLISLLCLALWYRLRNAAAPPAQAMPTPGDSERAEPAFKIPAPMPGPDPEPHSANDIEDQERPLETQEPAESATSTSSDQDTLVELLRPDSNSRATRFTPGEHATDTTEAGRPEPQIELEEETINDAPPAGRENPLRTRTRDEVQLDLYTFEHEMELMLEPGDAVYLLYIDTTTAHTEYADSSEREAMLQVYLQLARQVAHIYSGELEALPNGDFQIAFRQAEANDEHGVNAVCSGLLFTLLYRGYNQERIRQFKPVLNLHTGLVRGHHKKPTLLQEEARFLTRTTQSNELISHTALTEAPDIKRVLLKDADIRREDEDKVLIYKVEKRYQELFEKQSNHLLTKLRQRQEALQESRPD